MNDGFAIVPGVFDGGELDAIVRELGGEALRRSRAGARHLLSIPAVGALARDSRLMTLAADVLGCEPVPFGATLFDKSRDANWLVVWHQDTRCRSSSGERSLVGVPGRRRQVSCTRTLLQRRFPKS